MTNTMLNTQNVLSDITHYSKYARYNEKFFRRETFSETVDRNLQFHIDRFPQHETLLREAYSLVYDKLVLPSMRSMQFAGPALTRNHARSYNCSFMHMSDTKTFADLLFLLLSGCGTGYSVQRHHVAKLPEIQRPIGYTHYAIDDTIEGWADAVKALVDAYFYGQSLPLFDYSLIRPEGSPLKTSGGKAPGPKKLKEALEKVQAIFDNCLSIGLNRLEPIHVHDINCHLADCVAAGGIRRSAMISLFSIDDIDMIKCKSGAWWEKNGQRARANNSVVLLRGSVTKEQFFDLWQLCKESYAGEPGFFWTNCLEVGTNPCAEISLLHRQFCNLVTINFSKIKNATQFAKACWAASVIATFQASLTDFSYIHKDWKSTTEAEALIGVSMTGIADNIGLYNKLDVAAGARIVVETNAEIADMLGIKCSARCTTGKPDGTSSLILESASGIHARHNDYYFRTMRFGVNEPIASYLTSILPPDFWELDITDNSRVVIGMPVQSPRNSITREESAADLLKRTARQNVEWIQTGHRSGKNYNNQSVTISLRDHEWDSTRDWMWENQQLYTGISVLPYDGGTYQQAPFQDITAQRYAELVAMLPPYIDLTAIIEYEDSTSLSGEVACAGGACEVR
jgi:ribonucleoside-diphosphate reductase alpha chain